jgi:putative ABC transport system permease protein
VLEALMLGVIGGIGGALAATWGTRVLVGMAPADLPRLDNIAFDWNIGLTVVAIGAGIGLLAGLAPALWAVRTDLGTLMGSTRQRGSGGRVRMRRGMVVVQVALSVVLLTAGALVVRSFSGLLSVDPGFDAERALTLTVPVPGTRYPDADAAYALHGRLQAELAAVPGVSAVGAGWTLPLSAGSSQTSMRFPGAPGNTGSDEHDNPMIDYYAVRPGYFEALGIRVLDGATFRDAVAPGFEMVIDRTLAEKFYPDGTAVGAMIPLGDETARIIGVVDHVRLYDVHQDGRGQVFLRNAPGSLGMAYGLSWVVQSERTRRAPALLAADVTAAVRRVDPELAVSNVRTMSEVLGESLSEQRLSAVLIAGFSLGALLLAAMGLYGIVAGSVTRRRHELAIRMAMGAEHGSVLRLVLREGALLVALGVLIGVPGVLVAGRVIEGVLVGVSPHDPATLTAVALGLWAVAMAACYVPARRVLRIEPGISLRQE